MVATGAIWRAVETYPIRARDALNSLPAPHESFSNYPRVFKETRASASSSKAAGHVHCDYSFQTLLIPKHSARTLSGTKTFHGIKCRWLIEPLSFSCHMLQQFAQDMRAAGRGRNRLYHVCSYSRRDSFCVTRAIGNMILTTHPNFLTSSQRIPARSRIDSARISRTVSVTKDSSSVWL